MNNLAEVEMKAKALIRQYCPDYSFRWGKGKKTLGTCSYRRKVISLSKFYATHYDYETLVRDTVLHEIAHALAGHSAGHGPLWKRMCRFVGARPDRCKDLAIVEGVPSTHKWELHCKCMVHRYYRKPSPRTVAHSICRKCKGSLTLKGA